MIQRINFGLLLLVGSIQPHALAQEQISEASTVSKLEHTADYLRTSLDAFMQDTAIWLDNVSQYEPEHDEGHASAKGYVQLSWLPRSGDLSEVDGKFKVKFYLPKWQNRISLILDNDDDDDLKLDYEAESFVKDDSDKVNIALQSLTEFENLLSLRYRLGLSRGQLYTRGEFKKYIDFEHFFISISPRIDYYSKDGWAPGIKSVLSYPFGNDLLSASVSWQKLQFEAVARQKMGVYWVKNLKADSVLVTGIQYNMYGTDEDRYLASVRYRERIYKDWAFIEIEPFVEFPQKQDYHREFGIGLRLIASYGE